MFALTESNRIKKCATPASMSLAIQVSPNGRLLAATTIDGGAIVFDQSGRQECIIPPDSSGETAEFLNWGYGDRYLKLRGRVFEIPSGRLMYTDSDQMRVTRLNPANSSILLKSKSSFLTANLSQEMSSDQKSMLAKSTKLARMSKVLSSIHSVSSDGMWIVGQPHGFDSFYVFQWSDGALLASKSYAGSMGHLGFAGNDLVHFHISDENVVCISGFKGGAIELHRVVKIGGNDSHNVSDIVCNHTGRMLILFEPVDNEDDNWFYAEFDISALHDFE